MGASESKILLQTYFESKSISGDSHAEVVKLLLTDPRVNPADDKNYAIRCASQNGHVEVVRILLADPRVNPVDCDNYAIKYASYDGRVEVVKELSLWYYNIDNIISIINTQDNKIDLIELRNYLEEVNMIKFAGRT